jgi:surface protein
MFSGCSKLTKADLTGYDLSNVTTMYEMFSSCILLEEVIMTSEISKDLDATQMFSRVKPNGTFYYNPNYDYSKIIAQLPSTWTAVPLT